VDSDIVRIPSGTPFSASILEISYEFLLLRVDRDHWELRFQEGSSLGVDVLELGVAVHVGGALAGLAIGLKTVTHVVEKFANQ
jgi:hypothetical protein